MNASGFGLQRDSNSESERLVQCADKRARLLRLDATSAVSLRDPRSSRHRFRVALVAVLAASQMILLLLLSLLLLHLTLLLTPASTAPTAHSGAAGPGLRPDHFAAADVEPSGRSDLRLATGPQHLRAQHPALVDALRLRDEPIAPRDLLRRLRADSPTAARLRLALGALLADTPDADADTNSNSDATLADCAALAELRDAEYLASGWTKAVFRARLPSRTAAAADQLLAVKAVDPRGKQILQCLQTDAPLHCRHEATLKLLSEALLLRRLQHPAVLRIRGSCATVALAAADSPSASASASASGVDWSSAALEVDVRVATELAQPLDLLQLLDMSWRERLQVAEDLLGVLQFLSRSPLGPLVLGDFKIAQFVRVGSRATLKLSDLDDLNPAAANQTECRRLLAAASPLLVSDWAAAADSESASDATSRGALCEQVAADSANLHNAYLHFFKFLLLNGAPDALARRSRALTDSIARLERSSAYYLHAVQTLRADADALAAHSDSEARVAPAAHSRTAGRVAAATVAS